MALGRTKIGRRQKAESSAEQPPAEPDRELESYLAALTPEDDVESTGTGRRFGTSEVHQLRLPAMANERLNELAAQQGTSPSVLLQDWVMRHLELDEPSTPDSSAPDSSAPTWPRQEDKPSASPAPGRSGPGQPQTGPGLAGPPGRPQARPAPPRPAPHQGQASQQYAGDLNPRRGGSRQQDPEPETDTEITVPGKAGYGN